MRVLLISGSTRTGSTNTALLRTAAALDVSGVEAELFAGLTDLPHFNPDDDRDPAALPPAVVRLRGAIRDADALLYCIPEYAGALPGSLKNLLDWTVGGGETYGKPVAWVNVSVAATGAADAHHSLRLVLDRTGARIVEDACVHLPVPRSAVGADGLVADPEIRARLGEVLAALAVG